MFNVSGNPLLTPLLSLLNFVCVAQNWEDSHNIKSVSSEENILTVELKVELLLVCQMTHSNKTKSKLLHIDRFLSVLLSLLTKSEAKMTEACQNTDKTL